MLEITGNGVDQQIKESSSTKKIVFVIVTGRSRQFFDALHISKMIFQVHYDNISVTLVAGQIVRYLSNKEPMWTIQVEIQHPSDWQYVVQG